MGTNRQFFCKELITRRVLRCTFLCIFLFAGRNGWAQDCTGNLDQAKAWFQDGMLYDIPVILEECLTGGFTKEQRVEAYELLSLTYLYIDEPDKADESYLNLLKFDPEWAPDTTTEVEIDFLSKKFKTTPIFTIYPVSIGVNLSFVKVIHANGTDNTYDSRQNYKTLAGGQIGAGVDWNISDQFSLAGEFWFTIKDYRFNNNYFPVDSFKAFGFPTGDSISIAYNYVGVELPVFLRYTYKIYNWYPFVYGGYSISYIFSATAKPSYFDNSGTDDGVDDDRVVNPDIGRPMDINRIRTAFNQSLLMGAGVKYRMGYKFISFDVRYSWGLNNMLNTKNQFDFGDGGEQHDIRELTFRYGQVDDDFRLNNLYFNLRFVSPIYKPRRIEKTRGGIFSNFFKKKDKTEI